MLVGCTEGHANCMLRRSRNLIGLEVITVDGQDLRPEKGMVRQILDSKAAAPTVALEFNSREANGDPTKDHLRPAMTIHLVV